MRIPYELLTGLANSLVNDTIFEIVKRLMEIQHVTENHLQQLRKQVENEHQSKILLTTPLSPRPTSISYPIAIIERIEAIEL